MEGEHVSGKQQDFLEDEGGGCEWTELREGCGGDVITVHCLQV